MTTRVIETLIEEHQGKVSNECLAVMEEAKHIDLESFLKDAELGYKKACEKLNKAGITNQIIFLGQRADAIKEYEFNQRRSKEEIQSRLNDYYKSKNPHFMLLLGHYSSI